jgi:hypothetical protein
LLVVAAQLAAPVPRIGLLSIFSPALGESKAESFRQGLRELGYMEGQNIRLESRWAEGHLERVFKKFPTDEHDELNLRYGTPKTLPD